MRDSELAGLCLGVALIGAWVPLPAQRWPLGSSVAIHIDPCYALLVL